MHIAADKISQFDCMKQKKTGAYRSDEKKTPESSE